MIKKFSNQSGHTLLEIPVVLVIIGSLSLGAVKATEILPQVRDAKRAAGAVQISTALAMYYDDHLVYPEYTGSNPEMGWQLLEQELVPNYLHNLPDDPLDEIYSYHYWSDNQKAIIYYVSEIEGKEKERWVY